VTAPSVLRSFKPENKSINLAKAIRICADGFLHFTFSSKNEKLKTTGLKITIKIYFCNPYHSNANKAVEL
jgi:hypothetical protein